MLSTFSLFIILLLVFAVVTLTILYFISRSHRSRINNFARSRGINMTGGETKELKCENGRKICVYRAVQVCTSGLKQENPTTDPMSDGTDGGVYGNFNPNTTTSLTDDLKNQCNGKETCQYYFAGDGSCTGISQMIGTYACLAPGSDCQSYD